jgi:hypothetical protein
VVAEPVPEAIVPARVERSADRPRRAQPALEPESQPAERTPAATGDTNGIERPRAAARAALPDQRETPTLPSPTAFTPKVSIRPAPPEIARPAAAESPTIHVTIGRVEIRAATAPPVPRRASPRPPAMSLEQYLKQRRGASRE